MGEMILCLYSGGLDSAGMLHFLLKEDKYKDFAVHVHHLHLVNVENRAPVEAAMTQAALKYFADNGYRKFSYSESMHKYPAFNSRIIRDADLCAFMAGNICNASPDIRLVALGRTKTDTEQAGQELAARLARAQDIFNTVRGLSQDPPEYLYPVEHLTKRELWEAMPPDLRKLTWSCRRPLYGEDKTVRACGRCVSCVALGIAPPTVDPGPASPPAEPAPPAP